MILYNFAVDFVFLIQYSYHKPSIMENKIFIKNEIKSFSILARKIKKGFVVEEVNE